MQRTPSNSPPTGPAKPSKALPPIRMGDRSDWVRKEKAKAEEKHVAESKIRTRIYQDILTLLDLAERLTLDLSCHEDRFGIEWSALAKQIHAQYHAAVVQIVPGFQAKIMSKEGAHGLPKGLYRHLLDFAEECVAFVKWTRSPSTGNFDGAPGSMSAPRGKKANSCRPASGSTRPASTCASKSAFSKTSALPAKRVSSDSPSGCPIYGDRGASHRPETAASSAVVSTILPPRNSARHVPPIRCRAR